MNHPQSRVPTLVSAGLGALVTLGALICASDDLRVFRTWLPIWALLPFCVLFLVGCFARSRGVLSTATAAAIICGLGSLYYFYTMFFARPDAQGALIFLSLPFFQLALVLLAVGVAALVCCSGHRCAFARKSCSTNPPQLSEEDLDTPETSGP